MLDLRTRFFRGVVLAAVAFAAGCGGAMISVSSASAAPSTSAMNGFSLSKLPAAQRDGQLDAMAAQGVKEVRSDAAWATIEPLAPVAGIHSWQFASTDAWVTQLAEHGLRWEPIVDYSVGWAKTCPGFCAPSVDSTFATFAQAVAARYGERGAFWSAHPGLPYLPAQIFEIWNEENQTLFAIPAARYDTLYRAAHDAIHAVDPSASVDVGGLAEDASQAFYWQHDYAWWYIQQMTTADPSIASDIDAVALHPYGLTAVDAEKWVNHFRTDLALVGLGSVPLDITEMGWTTGDAARESWRAQQMGSLGWTLGYTNCGIRLVAPYTWINPTVLNEGGDFGFVDPSNTSTTLRPAGSMWFTGLADAAARGQNQLCAAGSYTPPAR